MKYEYGTNASYSVICQKIKLLLYQYGTVHIIQICFAKNRHNTIPFKLLPLWVHFFTEKLKLFFCYPLTVKAGNRTSAISSRSGSWVYCWFAKVHLTFSWTWHWVNTLRYEEGAASATASAVSVPHLPTDVPSTSSQSSYRKWEIKAKDFKQRPWLNAIRTHTARVTQIEQAI